jgi:hypothetical protein
LSEKPHFKNKAQWKNAGAPLTPAGWAGVGKVDKTL